MAKLNHIGIAIGGQELIRLFKILEVPFFGEEVVPSQNVKTLFFDGSSPKIELLEPVGEGAISDFIQKKKGGIHHIAFEVEDLEAVTKKCQAEKFVFVYQNPQPAAHGCRMNFIHPRSTGGVLVELLEK